MSTMTKMPAQETAAEPAKGGRTKLLVILLVGVLAAGAAGWFFLLRPSGPAEPEAPKPGAVVALEPIQVNLAGGHYLRLALALQTVEGAEEVDGSKALDDAIDLFTGLKMEQLTKPSERAKLKQELEHQLEEQYEGEVMAVYFTQFVTQ